MLALITLLAGSLVGFGIGYRVKHQFADDEATKFRAYLLGHFDQVEKWSEVRIRRELELLAAGLRKEF